MADNQRRRILFWIGAAAPVFAAAGVLAVRATREREAFSTVDARHWYHELRTKLDTAYPARGITDYTGGHVGDVPKGYAMVLLAELTYRRRHRDHPLTLARTAGSWLLHHRDENRDGVIGWGVPAAWDAYGDGSTNPANTEYTISTAIVVDALLDWLERTVAAPELVNAAQPLAVVLVESRDHRAGSKAQHSFEVFFGKDEARTPLIVRVPFELGVFSLRLVE